MAKAEYEGNVLMTLEQALAIIALLDERTDRADKTCAEPGISLSEAARRILIDERHPAFVKSGD